MSNAQFPSSSMSFSINLKYGNVDVVVIGQIQRVNKPSALPWLLLAIVAGAIVVASATYWPSMRRQIIGVAIAILVVVDIFHAIGATQFSHEQTRATFVATFFSENFFLIPSWLLGTLGLILVLRRRTDGYYAISFAAISIALFGGFFDILSLSRPLLPNAFDDVFTRASVALSIGMGLATAATAFKTVMGDPQRRHLTNIQVSTETADKIVV